MIGGTGPFADRQIPDARVPLADEAAPVLHRQIDRLVAHFERGFLVAIGRSCQQIDAIELAVGQAAMVWPLAATALLLPVAAGAS